MLRNVERGPGFNIFLGVGDTVERALSILQDKVREAEQTFEVDVKSFNLKYGEKGDRDNIYATQVAVLAVKKTPVDDSIACIGICGVDDLLNTRELGPC